MMLLRVSLFCLMMGTGILTAQAPVSTPQVGPYTISVTDTATILWSGDPITMKFGSYGRLESTASAVRSGQVALTGLKPGLVYGYEIPGLGTGSFTTPPSKETAIGLTRYSFAILGDTRGDNEIHRQVATAIAAARPAFVVHAGDLVERPTDPADWISFFDASRPYLRSAAFYPAMGNYDANSPFWHRYFQRQIAYYSFDWGRAHWAIVNSQVKETGDPEAYWRDQLEWLERDLAANAKADYLFVVVHHPPFSAVKSHQDESADVARRVLPLIRKYKVSAVFSGHDHNYQRHLDGGIPFIVSAGAGEPLYDVNNSLPGITQKAEKADCFVLGKVDGARISFEARTAAGRVIDTFQISARTP